MNVPSSLAPPNSPGARFLFLVTSRVLNNIVAIYLLVIGVWSVWWTAGYCAWASTC